MGRQGEAAESGDSLEDVPRDSRETDLQGHNPETHNGSSEERRWGNRDSKSWAGPISVASAKGVEALLHRIRRSHGRRVTGELELPAQAARYEPFPSDLDPRLVSALNRRGISALYRHQALAWVETRASRHSVVVTPTASGKTLCYNLPVMQGALESGAKALYLFPTKALSQDQVAEILALNQAGDLGIRAYTFDGDTPGDARKAVRTRGDILVTNPDMLHQGILPHHTKWAQFFESVRYVVIDELHTYRGVFGAHMANVMRRLQRICAFYGSTPTFVMCSATIANPKDLAEALLEQPVGVIDNDGAPRGKRTILLWNPPVVNRDLGIRAAARSQSAWLAKAAVKLGLKSIVFAQTRTMVEVLTRYLKDTFDKDPRKPPRVRAYRGGYLPTERRSAERDLRGGGVDCVVATSALELGVDIGALDVCVLNGYPGTIAGAWQRWGRAGRRQRPALGVLVASSLALDQFIVRNPEFFFAASPEHARVDPNQLLILLDHVRCAAFELPFKRGARFGTQPVTELLRYLEEDEVLHYEGEQWHWMTDSYPAGAVSLRTVAEGNFVVIDRTGGGANVIAEVDYSGAPMTLYEGAIYMVQARPWQVENLDWDGRKAFVRSTDADYYTEAIDYTKLKVLEVFEGESGSTSGCGNGEVHVVRRISGYKKIRYYTHENVGYGRVTLPDQEMHTTALWWRVPSAVLEQSFLTRWQALDGFLGAAHALHLVAVLMSMSEPTDLGRSVGNSDGSWFSARGMSVGKGKGEEGDAGTRGPSPASSGPLVRGSDGEPVDLASGNEGPGERFEPTVYLYDNFPGGIGLSTPLYEQRGRIVSMAVSLVQGCACESGCPACIGPILAGEESRERGVDSPRSLALRVLMLLDADPDDTLDPAA